MCVCTCTYSTFHNTCMSCICTLQVPLNIHTCSLEMHGQVLLWSGIIMCICTCMCVCTYVYMYVYNYVCVYVCVYIIYVHVCVYVWVYVCVYHSMYVCVYVCVCMWLIPRQLFAAVKAIYLYLFFKFLVLVACIRTYIRTLHVRIHV